MTKFEPKTVEVKKFFPETHKHADKSVLLTVMVVDHQPSSELDESERLIVPEVIEEGDNVTFSDKAVVHFTVKAAKTGETIQSSYDDGEPTKLEIKLGDGMHEGIRLMSKGEKARLHIPVAKDCCFRGDFEGDVVVDVELLDIEPNEDVTNFWNPGRDPFLEMMKEHNEAIEKLRLGNSA